MRDDASSLPAPLCVMFDLDGTLLDTLTDLATAMNGALRRLGFPEHPIHAYRHFIGDGVETLAKRALPADARDDDTISRCTNEMRQIYSDAWAVHTRPYDGIPQLLDRLTDAEIPFCVLSNKPHEMTVKVVERLLGQWNFRHVDGAKAGVPRKPDPTAAVASCERLGVTPASVAYVGDTNTDMQTARSAGMQAVGALWGFRDEAELLRAGAQHTISRPAALLPLLHLA